MCRGILDACMSVYHMPSYCPQSQKKGSYALELEVQMIVAHHEGSRNQSLVICNSSHGLNHRAALQSSDTCFLMDCIIETKRGSVKSFIIRVQKCGKEAWKIQAGIL